MKYILVGQIATESHFHLTFCGIIQPLLPLFVFSKKGFFLLENLTSFFKIWGEINSALSMYEDGLTLVRVRIQILIITSTSEVTKGGLIISAVSCCKIKYIFYILDVLHLTLVYCFSSILAYRPDLHAQQTACISVL